MHGRAEKSAVLLATLYTTQYEQKAQLAVAERPCDCSVGQFWPNVLQDQNKRYHDVQDHSRSPMLVPIEREYASY